MDKIIGYVITLDGEFVKATRKGNGFYRTEGLARGALKLQIASLAFNGEKITQPNYVIKPIYLKGPEQLG